MSRGYPGGSVVWNSPANAGDVGSIHGLGRSSGERNDNPVQYSCLKIPMDGRAWHAIVHRVAKRVGHNLATKPTYTTVYRINAKFPKY